MKPINDMHFQLLTNQNPKSNKLAKKNHRNTRGRNYKQELIPKPKPKEPRAYCSIQITETMKGENQKLQKA